MSNEIRELAALLTARNYVMAFTGAGISTDSGIPDFRGSEASLWHTMDPKLLSSAVLRGQPDQFFRFYKQILPLLKGKKPNAGHYALAELSKLRIIKSVVTQNIDGLHQQAGSKRVVEIHGSSDRCLCVRCSREYSHDVLEEQLRDGPIPFSPCCGEILRPTIVLFGDKMTASFRLAQEEAFRADFALVIGTSLSVFPAAELPLSVGMFGIINGSETPFDDKAAIVIRGSSSETLAKLVSEIKTMDY